MLQAFDYIFKKYNKSKFTKPFLADLVGWLTKNCLMVKKQKKDYLGAFFYYVRVIWGFLEPPTHLYKDIFTT